MNIGNSSTTDNTQHRPFILKPYAQSAWYWVPIANGNEFQNNSGTYCAQKKP